MQRLALLLLLVLTASARADTVRVAVAANFADALKQLATAFEAETGHAVSVSVGSTGKLFAQIRHGAPFEVFFAADVERPRLLEEAEVGVPGTRATYAIGRLALWVPGEAALADPEEWIRSAPFDHLAVANPKLAPYGVAARKTIRKLRMWRSLKSKLVRGENIGQAFHFVESGAAQGGFVALSQVRRPGSPAQARGTIWEVPADRHEPVEQQAILLFDAPGPRAFLAYVLGPKARPVLEAYGYGTPTP